MSNILNHNRNVFDIKLDKSDYWDFHLCIDNIGNSDLNIDENNCLSVYIDTNDNNCIWFDKLLSKSDCTWDKSINDGLTLNSIGFTGIDNGLITYEKDKITNKEFIDIFVNSTYSIEKNDKRLVLHKVDGNNQIYSYDADITILDNIQVVKLNGGFYQGFFKSGNYQVLPYDVNNGISLSFTLKKEDFINENQTLNDSHPNNKGFFFYIGTRAENKWWEKYTTTIDYEECLQKYAFEYSDEYIQKDSLTNESYIKEDVSEKMGKYFADGYVLKKGDDKYFDENANCCDFYVKDEYYENDININENTKITTSEGYDLYQPNITEFKTDNKFITYNRTDNGLTVKKDDGNTEVVLYDIKTPNMENYFTLFDRTCNGYTTKNIQSLIDKENKKYDVLSDLYNNALGFRITDSGEIGYRFLVKDCENNSYKIEEEYSKPNVIKNKEWVSIDVKIKPYNKGIQILFYVNGKVVLISKELPKLNLRELNDLPSKQEGVPFNISIGGGTQGLCDRVDINYMTPPSKILPLENHFAGTFIGYIKSFKFYTCPINYTILNKNVESISNLLN